VQLRFRAGSDDATALAGWLIDDISVSGISNTPFSSVVAEIGCCK